MMTTQIALCAVPKALWEALEQGDRTPPGIALLVRDALSIEKRLLKKVNKENERERYTLCCKQIETAARSKMQALVNLGDFTTLLDSGQFPAQTLDATYLDLLRRLHSDDGLKSRAASARVGASFYPPEFIAEHLQVFQQLVQELHIGEAPSVQKRITFLKFAARNDCGVVEIQTAHLPPDQRDSHLFELAARTTQGTCHPQRAKLYGDVGVGSKSDRHARGRDESMSKSLRRQINLAIAEPKIAVDFSNYRNDVITEVLHEFVYYPVGESAQPAEIRVLYADGSEARPFPLLCLPSHAEPDMTDAVTIRAALMSMRHLELDSKVDVAWLRNKEVSKSRPLAESDDYCYTKTLEQFSEITQHYDKLVLLLYQTGFEPAVLGFYRGLTEILREINEEKHCSLSSLVVHPYVYRNQGFQEGTPWY